MAIDTDDNDLVDAEACEKYLAQLRELEAYRAYRTTAAIDWFFDQATRAIHGELWLAACTTFGNILEHIITVSDGMGEPVRLFTPECMRDLAQTLSAVSKVWIAGLHQYWCDNNLSMP
ncbi:Uncharacterised protein [Salmonella enterica subsp. enterica serovar Typhi]|nr:Uncharacterised protein [Salmonella enterica subsp. enterica serovar Typhi]